MVTAQWHLLVLVAAVALNCALTYVLYRRMGTTWADWPAAGGTTGDDRPRVVACRSCGVENEREYRFCRSCVAELPGGVAGPAGRSNPFERAT